MRKLFILILIFLSGCVVKPTKVEKEEKERVEQVSRYLEEPKLPILNENSKLEDFIKYALLNNPKVKASFYEWKSAVEIISASRYLPNPNLTLESEISSRVESVMPGLMGMFPASGKIVLQSEAFSLEARKKRYLFEKEVLETAFKIKEISYQFWVLREKIKLVEKIIKILDELESLNLAKLKVGSVSQADILNIQIEKEQMKNILIDLEDSKRVLLAQFGSILGLSFGSKIPEPPEKLPFTEQGFSEEEIWEIVRQKNPRLAIMETEIKESEVFVKLSYKEYSPDFGIGLMKSFFSEMSMVKPMLTLSIPWRKKVSAMFSSAISNVKMAQAQYSAEELDLAVMLADALFRWRQANREFILYKDNLLPKVKAILELNKASYTNGFSNLVDFLVTERMFLDYSFNYLSAQAFREIALNEVSIIIAGILPERKIILEEAK
ncbi:MAG: TolC family protein [Candidatus Omnitrophica bacterium]|nr:TolC family protein [Candidatus Omnitrophota bacterium]